jgi:hypothetical protein
MEYTATYHLDFVNAQQPKAETWWPSTRNGTTGQGHTFVLEKEEDNLAEWDAFHSECKTSGAKSPNARVRLFTHAFGVEQDLLSRYGRVGRADTKRFGRQVRAGKPRNWNGDVVEMGLDEDNITLTAPSWQTKTPRATIDTVLTRKLSNLVIVNSQKRKSSERRLDGTPVDYDYRYPGFTFYGGLSSERFWDLFSSGRVAVEFRVRDGKDYGTCFNVSKKDIPLMYDFTYEWQGGSGDGTVSSNPPCVSAPGIRES